MPPSNAVEQTGLELKKTRLLEGILVYGMTTKQAAYFAGFSPRHAAELLKTPEMQEEAEAIRGQLSAYYGITKERVVKGMVDAIDRAKQLGDPRTEIAGWKELAQMHGLYAASEQHIKVSYDASRLERDIKEASHEELLKLATQSGNWQNQNAVDAEFIEVKDAD